MSTKWQNDILYYTMLMEYIPAGPGTSTLGGYSRTPGQHGSHRSFLQQWPTTKCENTDRDTVTSAGT